MGAARTQQKTSALGKSDANVIGQCKICTARTDRRQPAKVTVPSCKLGTAGEEEF